MIKKNDDYIVEITSMSHEGMGISKIEGYTIFVDGAIVGEKIKIKLVKQNKNFGFGKIIEILEPSKSRIQSECISSKRCGGCNLQHLDYKEQLLFKTNKVKETIERIGKIKDVIIHHTIGMDNPKRYRNKAQFPVGMKDSKVVFGFYASRSHEIIDTNECMIQDEQSEKIVQFIVDFINKNKISVYDEISHNGLIRHIVTRVGFKTDEVMVMIVSNGHKLTKSEQLVKDLTSRFPNIKSIIQNINTKETNVILGEKNITLYGKDSITDYIGELKFNISPLSFFQVNPIQTEVLYNKALEYANLSENETVFDAYCGIGTISLFLAKRAKKVYGIEIVDEAIEDAKENARLNNIENVEFIVGESEKVIPELYKNGITADVVVVDPPRKGCEKALLDTIVEMKPKRMVYVSCDVGTLARDLHILEDGGYKVKEIQPVDMFPWTHHVETVVLMSRVDK